MLSNHSVIVKGDQEVETDRRNLALALGICISFALQGFQYVLQRFPGRIDRKYGIIRHGEDNCLKIA